MNRQRSKPDVQGFQAITGRRIAPALAVTLRAMLAASSMARTSLRTAVLFG